MKLKDRVEALEEAVQLQQRQIASRVDVVVAAGIAVKKPVVECYTVTVPKNDSIGFQFESELNQ